MTRWSKCLLSGEPASTLLNPKFLTRALEKQICPPSKNSNHWAIQKVSKLSKSAPQAQTSEPKRFFKLLPKRKFPKAIQIKRTKK